MPLPLIPIISGLASLAPTVAGWLGGSKAEDAAQKVADMARSVTGQNDVQQAVNAIKADPTMQLEFLKMLEQNKYALDKMYLDDRQDARKQHKDSKMPALLSLMLTAMMIGIVYALFVVTEMATENRELLSMVLGVVIREWAGAMHYWHGTTKGSADKNNWKK